MIIFVDNNSLQNNLYHLFTSYWFLHLIPVPFHSHKIAIYLSPYKKHRARMILCLVFECRLMISAEVIFIEECIRLFHSCNCLSSRRGSVCRCFSGWVCLYLTIFYWFLINLLFSLSKMHFEMSIQVKKLIFFYLIFNK
jgi:hypothetical protein